MTITMHCIWSISALHTHSHTHTHSLWYCYLSEITLMRCSCAFERAICFVYNLICYIVSSRKLLFIFCRQGRVYLVSYHKYIISDYYYYSYFIDKALSIRCVVFVMSCNLWYCQIFSPTKNRCFFFVAQNGFFVVVPLALSHARVWFVRIQIRCDGWERSLSLPGEDAANFRCYIYFVYSVLFFLSLCLFNMLRVNEIANKLFFC